MIHFIQEPSLSVYSHTGAGMERTYTHRRLSIIIVMCVILFLLACSGMPRVTRLDSGTTTDISGRWNDTDSRLVSKKMISEMLDNPWYKTWTGEKGTKPVVIVGRITNETMEHINSGAFMADLERDIINSGKISFVAGGKDRDDVRRERLDQLSNSSEESIKEFGREIGADFMLFGSIISFVDQAGGTKIVTYQVDMYLVDIEKNTKTWAGQEKIKKEIKRSRFKL